jgi:hypothetical protein
MMMLAKTTLTLLLTAALAQPICHAQQPSQTPPSTQSADRAEQMRADLNQMESLMNNMQSEINFLRDQNLQILLNTNVRMWTILIRDLRRQLDEEQRRSPTPTHATSPHQ